VNAASRMLRAISLGVFWRRAPSTMAIMRSRKPSPGMAVTRITSQSERTRVPPVTAERSPPDSRITGALSPVTALSSTEATPSTTSPSLAMMSPVSTRKMSSLRRLLPDTSSYFAPCFGSARRLAWVSRRVRRRAAACALPRPSASASEKLANRTHSHSQRVMPPMKAAPSSACLTRARTQSTVVRTLPTSVTNMTGLRTIQRGLSFINASMAAWRYIPRPKPGSFSILGAIALPDHELLDDWPQGQGREGAQRADDDDHGDEPEHEQRRVRGQRPGRLRHGLLLHQ
jgi:hypothetical protein